MSDLDFIAEAAREAGRIALTHFRGDPQVWEKDDDQGPVTEADLAVDAFLKERLLGGREGYGWLSEETADDEDRLSRSRIFIVDPIDGTRAFMKGETAWSISIAVIEDGAPVAGVVYLPAKETLYSASRGDGATLDGRPIRVSRRDALDGAHVLAAGQALKDDVWSGEVPAMRRHFRTSLAYRMSLVGEGRFDAMMTLRETWEWDIAAGTLIASEAGALVTDRSGRPLSFNTPQRFTDGVVAAPPALHAEALARLR
ncbi:inositol monophosphatase [Tropicimonas sp. IMCC34011]|uniref:inositol monophosphatase family protein n=1 Tax=Tropicimonas sp. IMCC34011 TaxID=2248759 RepID=UPI00351A64BB